MQLRHFRLGSHNTSDISAGIRALAFNSVVMMKLNGINKVLERWRKRGTETLTRGGMSPMFNYGFMELHGPLCVLYVYARSGCLSKI